MTDNTITLRVPITMKIGPVPAELNTPDKIFSFGIQNFGRVLAERNVAAVVDGEHAIATFALPGQDAKSQTARGLVLDGRAFRIQPDGNKHKLETSLDLGTTFNEAGSFISYDFAQAIGNAWVDGRVE